ncbi:hypothetical protein BJ322DRAFT_1221197 [Thelephora terrestris]|uniref:INO80 complex subunit F domain-containing protein n=1 Tax=Thelephora terrestris TaxID=56493 RepID=A0A9P6H7R7_9AGAM|nr:hypothetical protein BJ322DRAFT_1221197 [Thelephora terrestris]
MSLPSSQTHELTQISKPRMKLTQGVAAGAEDQKYHSKYRDLKKKVKELEADNDRLHFKVLEARKNVTRMKLERAQVFFLPSLNSLTRTTSNSILYERLCTVPSTDDETRRGVQDPPISLPPPPQGSRPSDLHPDHRSVDRDAAVAEYIRNHSRPGGLPGASDNSPININHEPYPSSNGRQRRGIPSPLTGPSFSHDREREREAPIQASSSRPTRPRSSYDAVPPIQPGLSHSYQPPPSDLPPPGPPQPPPQSAHQDQYHHHHPPNESSERDRERDGRSHSRSYDPLERDDPHHHVSSTPHQHPIPISSSRSSGPIPLQTQSISGGQDRGHHHHQRLGPATYMGRDRPERDASVHHLLDDRDRERHGQAIPINVSISSSQQVPSRVPTPPFARDRGYPNSNPGANLPPELVGPGKHPSVGRSDTPGSATGSNRGGGSAPSRPDSRGYVERDRSMDVDMDAYDNGGNLANMKRMRGASGTGYLPDDRAVKKMHHDGLDVGKDVDMGSEVS